MDSSFQHISWSFDSAIYEVNLRQYTQEGTFTAFARQLPRLRDMGIEILWFMPVTPISVVGRLGSLGSYYACSDYTSTNPEYGSVDDFKSLVGEAHIQGFKVIIDWVANHTGWDHHWTKDHPDFYRKNHEGHFFDSHGWNDVIDLNYDNPLLRETMMDCMQFWVDECGIDGFRCDMAMLVPLDFWKEARTRLDAIRPLFWLAECEDIPYHDVFDATYTWKFLHAMEAYWKGSLDMNGLKDVLHFYDDQFPKNAMRAYFTTNHDENSHSGSEYERMGDSAIPFAIFCATWNGLPLIYSGQELPNLKRLAFFDKDPISWTGNDTLHDFYRALLLLRKRKSCLRGGDPEAGTTLISTNADDRVLVFLRQKGEDRVLVVLNLSVFTIDLNISDERLHMDFEDVFTRKLIPAANIRFMQLKPWEYRVLEK